MRVSEHWLREWADPAVDTDGLTHRLTMAGLEVDAVEPVAGAFSGVVVGRIEGCEAHPEADKLQVCTVSDGAATFQVVCGAANARAGLVAPFAREGAVLPDGTTIRATRLRGVESRGMLCSATELGLGEGSEGLLELGDGAEVGADLREWLGLDDTAIEIDLTPNRGDCLSVRGLAREVGALFDCDVAEPAVPDNLVTGEAAGVRVLEPAACPRYLVRPVRGIDPATPTPTWLKERLRRSGLRSLGLVVDITNYVLLELGQPLHAFDADRLNGGLQVRFAEEGESLTLLDGAETSLAADMLVIADEAGPTALAGIMGGAGSAVDESTRNIVLEAAFFTPEAILGRARRLGLHTDASHRFERGVDPALPRLALERATALLTQLAGGEPGPITEVTDTEALPRWENVPLRHERLNALLGTDIDADTVLNALRRLGMQESEHLDGWRVVPPSHRFDISVEEDLVEEVARVVGYDQLPAALPAMEVAAPRQPEGRLPASRLRRLMAHRDYLEAITYSFVDARLQRRLEPGLEPLALANPLSAEMDVMRTSLWPGLLTAVQHNRHRQRSRVRLFELGQRFRPEADGLQQENALAAAAIGPRWPEQWGAGGESVDLFDLKGDLEAIIGATGAADAFTFEADSHPALHPGQSARIYREGEPVGWLGALHPVIAEELDLAEPVYLFEIAAEALTAVPLPTYRTPSRYPAIRRDLAVVVDEAVAAADVLAVAREAAGDWLRDSRLFDVYRGKGIDSGRKSLGLGLTLQDDSRTLTDSDVEAVTENVVQALSQRLGATLRD
ncbi:phenylalanyl-tRNA synthetase beta subunit [Thiohalospira halophila DSM 15071]|uniref:Phenylalanine--tRNA ligase beta subunit n=1 Tax=Thiohalospira halophila DSM 15071 TaxID=1123397 RepID=A0A1I1MXN8_9GAMM|nr:phenylalanine--tRNA ligase subunit beta [Thiohalospira halophila]SFC90119.1 phenylalanyl-tRNA synthetase beta subunit [Thiohalospira halophila DSM 15071]